MKLGVEYRSGSIAKAIRASYRRDDFSLDYRHEVLPPVSSPNLGSAIDESLGIHHERNVLAIADTLTVAFGGEQSELVAFDAYTNEKLWSRSSSLVLPPLSGSGRLFVSKPIRDDRIDLGVIPEYTCSQDRGLLRVSLGQEAMTPTYYRVSDHLIVGIVRGNLTMLLVENLSIGEPG